MQWGRVQFLIAAGWAASSVNAEEEKATDADKSMSLTLLGSILFMMSLYYLTNWPDKDIRQYTYEVISATISIFAAVLMFQSFNDGLIYFIGDVGDVTMFFVSLVHQLGWYVVMQVFLAYCSGSIHTPKVARYIYIRDKETRAKMGSTSLAEALEDKTENGILDEETKESIMENMEANMKCFAVLLAHMTGFASINSWGLLQHLPFFSSTWYMSLLAIPVALSFQMILQRITDKIRYHIAFADDGAQDECEKMWDEECEEAENDITGLTMSFLLVQSIRFAINGPGGMPDVEGAVPEDMMKSVGMLPVSILAGFAGLFCLIVFVMRLLKPDRWEEEDKEEEKEGGLEEHMGGSENGSEEFKKRYYEMALTVFGMSFAWCWFFSAKGAISTTGLEGEVLCVCVSLVVSGVSFAAMFVLDKLADADWTGPKADAALILVIRSIGFLIGFAWEQTFDASVGALSQMSNNPHLAKIFLAFLCVLVVVPAWRLYMLPMVIQAGWACGFIINEKSVNAVLAHLMENADGNKNLKKSMDVITAFDGNSKEGFTGYKQMVDKSSRDELVEMVMKQRAEIDALKLSKSH